MPIIFREPGLVSVRELSNCSVAWIDSFRTLSAWSAHPGKREFYPLVNMSEDRDHIYVRAELPGVKAADLEITIQDNSLILRGQRQIATEEKQVNYHRRERESGFFRRVVTLPARIQADKVEDRHPGRRPDHQAGEAGRSQTPQDPG